MTSIVNPSDSIEVQHKKLLLIAQALMNRVENTADRGGEGFTHFQTAISLGQQIKERTHDLEDALEHLNKANAELTSTKAEAEAARMHLANALEAVREGFAVFDGTGRMVTRNSRFCGFLPDINPRIEPPMTYHNYVNLVCESTHLALETDAERAAFRKNRLDAHMLRHVNFTVELKQDRWVQVAEHHTPDGGTVILQTEITDTVRYERLERDKLLDAQALRVRATLDHLNQGVAIFDDKNLLVRSNKRLIELLNPPVHLLRSGTSFATISDYFVQQRVFADEDRLQKFSNWVSDGTRVPLSLQLSTVNNQVFDLFCQPMPDHGFVVSLTDVTTQTEAEKALTQLNETLEQRVRERTKELQNARDDAERANDTRTRFVAAVSHDLLQPLNAAKLFLAGMKENPLDVQEAGKLLRAKNALGSVETILGALLDITRLDTAEPGINRGDLRLDPILRTLASEYRELAATKGMEFTVDSLDVTIDSDQTYFRRVMQNLISNAIKYTSQGEVRVTASLDGDEVVLKVTDTGSGIPPEQQSAVFAEFVSLPNANPNDQGMGLGLAIVERACRLLGHPLTMTSTLGKGTEFELRVPISHAIPARPETRRQASPTSKVLKGLAALLIENDRETSAALAQLLDAWEMHTFEAASLAEASHILSEVDLTPDVILSDFHLDDAQNGLVAIRRLKNRFGAVPSVLITADRSVEVSALSRREKVGMVLKPVEPDALRAQIERALSPRPLAR
jgi:signal transduction histidine kinase